MRIRTLLAFGFAVSSLAACSDSSTGAQVYRVVGVLNNDGFATVVLPREVGSPSNLPALTCYTAQPNTSVWFEVGSVELPARYFPNIPDADRVLDNCIIEPNVSNPQQLNATIEGQPPNWQYAFTIIY